MNKHYVFAALFSLSSLAVYAGDPLFEAIFEVASQAWQSITEKRVENQKRIEKTYQPEDYGAIFHKVRNLDGNDTRICLTHAASAELAKKLNASLKRTKTVGIASSAVGVGGIVLGVGQGSFGRDEISVSHLMLGLGVVGTIISIVHYYDKNQDLKRVKQNNAMLKAFEKNPNEWVEADVDDNQEMLQCVTDRAALSEYNTQAYIFWPPTIDAAQLKCFSKLKNVSYTIARPDKN